MKKWIKERVEFYFMKKAYILGVMFFPKMKGFIGSRTEIRVGLGLFAVGVCFGKKQRFEYR